MGIRLYPKDCSPEVMEKLAQVPEGTWKRLEEYEAKRPVGGEELTSWYQNLFDDFDFTLLYSFKTNGYGALTAEAVQIVREIGDENAGFTEDLEKVKLLLEVMGVEDVELIKSVRWG